MTGRAAFAHGHTERARAGAGSARLDQTCERGAAFVAVVSTTMAFLVCAFSRRRALPRSKMQSPVASAANRSWYVCSRMRSVLYDHAAGPTEAMLIATTRMRPAS